MTDCFILYTGCIHGLASKIGIEFKNKTKEYLKIRKRNTVNGFKASSLTLWCPPFFSMIIFNTVNRPYINEKKKKNENDDICYWIKNSLKFVKKFINEKKQLLSVILEDLFHVME